jgi:molecular chaperone DnaJ
VREETVTIGIPPGIPEGAALRLAGRGLPGPVPGGPPGNTYVSIRTRADPGSPGTAPICGTTCTFRHPNAVLGVTTAVPVPGGQARVRCHREPAPAACCTSQAGACRAMAGTAAAA